jgi:selenide,water dikinase
VLRIDDGRAIVQTVDFFTPIVDDPELFGAIAATNSVSDIYAMGATPILGLAIAAFPTKTLPLSVLEAILRGGANKATEAGFPVGGGHTIIDDVPKYGLAVTGIVDADKVVRNSTAKPGDFLYLTKPIGNGILISAYRALSPSKIRSALKGGVPSLDEAIAWMTTLNRDAALCMVDAHATAATDVTGYGLVGHLLEMCEGSRVGAELLTSRVPVLERARDLLKKGYYPSGSLRNAETFRHHVISSVSEREYRLMCDAQTSGGLLVSIDPSNAPQFESLCTERGVPAIQIGRTTGRSGILELKA